MAKREITLEALKTWAASKNPNTTAGDANCVYDHPFISFVEQTASTRMLPISYRGDMWIGGLPLPKITKCQPYAPLGIPGWVGAVGETRTYGWVPTPEVQQLFHNLKPLGLVSFQTLLNEIAKLEQPQVAPVEVNETTDDLITRESLLADIGTIPTTFRTKYQRVAYVLSVLRGHANGLIAKAARCLYDGSISQMARRNATSTPEAVVDAVLARAHQDLDELEREMAEEERQAAPPTWRRIGGQSVAIQPESITEWVASISAPPELPADLFPDELLLAETDSERMILAWADALFGQAAYFSRACEDGQHHKCADLACECGCHEPWEPPAASASILPAARHEQAFWRDYDAKRDLIAMEACCRIDAMAEGLAVMSDEAMDFIESDEFAAWLGYPLAA